MRGRPPKKRLAGDGTGFRFHGPGSWQMVRFHRRSKKRDHRKAYLLVETGRGREKFVYDYRLDDSGRAEVHQAKEVLADLPDDTREVALDAGHDARDLYEAVESNGAVPVIKPRKGARTGRINARGRAIRDRLRRPTRWRRRYRRRVIVESVNSSLKRRFGARLRSRGVWNQRREFGLRVVVYNLCMLNRRRVRVAIRRGEL